ncbi:PAS domain-containing protein [Streptomyces sp. BI20]|uniref:PAS domain-containing protein n=1 Tax=Streptomyces sp. BI20 TaxID=3403460 RepID=UPI003C76CFE8
MSSRPSRGAARLAAILDALPDALLLVNANGTVVNANSIALEMLESPGTGLVGRGVLSLFPSFDSKLIPGSMRRPGEGEESRRLPTRMLARRTDGHEFPVEITSAHLDGRDAYREAQPGFTGHELLMLVVRDLSSTVDTEAELARSQRQTEMILRAAAEGVVGTDTEGRVVLVNPAAAQILGYRATDLGNRELHGLIQHSRSDGSPFPFEESPLADTLRSGRKHRVRGQVLWAKSGQPVAVDLTTSPVRDGEQLVGAVMTFTDRRPYDALAARHAQLLAVLDDSLRGPLAELRRELSSLAADDAGQLWPEANQLLHHLAAGYSRMTTLVDNVLAFQRLDGGAAKLERRNALLDAVVGAGVDGAVELIGPGRVQFAVHAPRIEAELDPERIATALAHLIADVAGVDATGKTAQGSGYTDATIVVAAAQRGDVVRIEVRGPNPGGDPVHGPLVRGIVAAHGGMLQTVDVPGSPGGAFVLELPIGGGRGTLPEDPEPEGPEGPDNGEGGDGGDDGGEDDAPHGQAPDGAAARPPRPRRGVDAFLDAEEGPAAPGAAARRDGRAALALPGPSGPTGPTGDPAGSPSGRRRGPAAETGPIPLPPADPATPGDGLLRRLVQGARPAAVPGVPAVPEGPGGSAGTGRRRGRAEADEQPVPTGLAPLSQPVPALPPVAGAAPAGRRRALGPTQAAEAATRVAPAGGFALPAADSPAAGPVPPAGRTGEQPAEHPSDESPEAGAVGRRARRALGAPATGEEPADPAPETAENTPTGRRRSLAGGAPAAWPVPGARPAPEAAPAPTPSVPAARQSQDGAARPVSVRALGARPVAHPAGPATGPRDGTGAAGTEGPESPSGRRRRLAEPAERPAGAPAPSVIPAPTPTLGQPRAFAIGAPAADAAEGPEPLDGPGGAVEVSPESTGRRPVPLPVDDELPPEPLDNPRRLLVWPAPDVATAQALTERGYRPVIVRSREEVDAQTSAFPAALFVDPLTGPITRTALTQLRQAAAAAAVPVLVTAGLGHASREATQGADPAVLLKALAPRDSEQHPSRVLLVEERDELAGALTAALERRGMRVGRAGATTDAVELAARVRPNLVVMDLMQVRRRRAGIVDWLRENGLLAHTPLVVYTAGGIGTEELARLGTGESTLFLAERSTSAESQGRIVDLLTKIGTR